jgi:NAD(P) transhydrogenase subunit alpha
MIVGIVKESFPNETRVAMVPALVPQLAKAGIEVVIESGAGDAAGFLDEEYSAKGAKVVPGRAEVFQTADLIAQVRALGANPEEGKADLELMRDGQAVVGMCEPLTEHDSTNAVAQRGAVLFSMEMMPRITRAQSMDVLSCCRRWPPSPATRPSCLRPTSCPRCSP